MDVKGLQALIQGLTPEGWVELYQWCCSVESPRRLTESARAEAQAEVVLQLRNTGGVKPPVAKAANPQGFTRWENPGSTHSKMYLLGDKVFHEGRVWESKVQGLNHWRPGAVGVSDQVWLDITDELFPPSAPEVLADGEVKDMWRLRHDYRVGDRAQWEDAVFEVVQAHRSQADWAPSLASSLWKKV